MHLGSIGVLPTTTGQGGEDEDRHREGMVIVIFDWPALRLGFLLWRHATREVEVVVASATQGKKVQK